MSALPTGIARISGASPRVQTPERGRLLPCNLKGLDGVHQGYCAARQAPDHLRASKFPTTITTLAP